MTASTFNTSALVQQGERLCQAVGVKASADAFLAGKEWIAAIHASRLGFRGTEDLGGGMAALYGLEMGISADSGITTSPTFRNSYVGLRGA